MTYALYFRDFINNSIDRAYVGSGSVYRAQASQIDKKKKQTGRKSNY